MLLSPAVGRMAMVKKMMPSPPIQCVMLRQNKVPWGRESMFERMVTPVVVKPDMFSKKASAVLVQAPVKSKGNMPMREKIIQVKVTMRKASR